MSASAPIATTTVMQYVATANCERWVQIRTHVLRHHTALIALNATTVISRC
jgi:hypothetical protein